MARSKSPYPLARLQTTIAESLLKEIDSRISEAMPTRRAVVEDAIRRTTGDTQKDKPHWHKDAYSQ